MKRFWLLAACLLLSGLTPATRAARGPISALAPFAAPVPVWAPAPPQVAGEDPDGAGDDPQVAGDDPLPVGIEPLPEPAAESSSQLDEDRAAAEGSEQAIAQGIEQGSGRGSEQGAEVHPVSLADAVQAYQAGHYVQAWERFAALAVEEPDPGRRAVLHANAGTAAARAERFGEAVWHLREALRLSPRDHAARRNLHQLVLRLGAGRDESQDLAQTLERLPLMLTPREARVAMSWLISLALLLLAVWRAGPGAGRVGPSAESGGPGGGKGGLAGRLARGAALACLLLAGAGWAADHLARAAAAHDAVLLTATEVRGEPGENGKLLFRLDPGTVVRHEEQRGDWSLVETSAGGRGWLPADSVRLSGGRDG